MKITRRDRLALKRRVSKFPKTLTRVPNEEWQELAMQVKHRPYAVWKSVDYLVQGFDEGGGVMRLSINKTSHNGDTWDDNITWDELQKIKNECGYGDACAVEIFPPDESVVNVANMRHLWLLPEPPSFMWNRISMYGG